MSPNLTIMVSLGPNFNETLARNVMEGDSNPENVKILTSLLIRKVKLKIRKENLKKCVISFTRNGG